MYIYIYVYIFILIITGVTGDGDDSHTPERHLPTPGQREHSPQRHTAAGTAAPTITDTGNTVTIVCFGLYKIFFHL